MARGFDPLEAEKVTPRAAPRPPAPPPPAGAPAVPSPAPSPADAQLEAVRHEREGTPVPQPDPEPVRVAPPQPPRPRPGRYYLVKKSQVISVGGHLTTLAKGSIVSEYSHDLEALAVQRVEWEPVDPG